MGVKNALSHGSHFLRKVGKDRNSLEQPIKIIKSLKEEKPKSSIPVENSYVTTYIPPGATNPLWKFNEQQPQVVDSYRKNTKLVSRGKSKPICHAEQNSASKMKGSNRSDYASYFMGDVIPEKRDASSLNFYQKPI